MTSNFSTVFSRPGTRVDLGPSEGYNRARHRSTLNNSAGNFEGWLRGTTSRVACFQIKRLRQKKELERLSTAYATAEWRKVTTQIFTGDAVRPARRR